MGSTDNLFNGFIQVAKQKSMDKNLYETDFYQWTVEQFQILSLGKFDRLDLINLAEEILSLGKQQQ